MVKCKWYIILLFSISSLKVSAQFKFIGARGNYIDTANFMGTRLNYTDTAAMLFQYQRKVDTIFASPFFIAGTIMDAGTDKINAIDRVGSIATKLGFFRSGSTANMITMDGVNTVGPVIDFGDATDSKKYLRLGYFNSINNLDVKMNHFKIISSLQTNGLFMNGTSGNISINSNSAVTVSSVGTTAAKFTVIGGDAHINNLTIGLGGGQIANNTTLGDSALFNNIDGVANTAVGYKTLYSNTSGGNHTGIGFQALNKNTIGTNNVGVGFKTLSNNTTGSYNTAFSWSSLNENTTGIKNTAIGNSALLKNNLANENSAIGYFTADSTVESFNTAAGNFALMGNTTGKSNVAIGSSALYNLTSGSLNTALGNNTANGILTGSSNTIIGANINGLNSNLKNTIILADGDGNKRIYIDSLGRVGMGNTSPKGQLEITHGTAGNAGLRFTNLNNTSNAVSATSINQKYLSLDSVGNVILAKVEDPIISVTGLAAGLVSPIAAATFQAGVFEGGASSTDSTLVYVNQTDGTNWIYSAASGGIYKSYAAPPKTEFYLAGSTTDAASNKTGSIYRTGTVGIGSNNSPNASTLLDLTSTSKGMLVPRMTKVQRDSIVSPASGMMVYCTNCLDTTGCISVYSGTSSPAGWNCLVTTNNAPIVTAGCTLGFQGTITKGFAVSSASYQVTLVNNTFTTATVPLANSNLVMSGANAGLSVSSVSTTLGGTAVTSVTLASGANQTIFYNLSGTPTSGGNLNGVWTNGSLACNNLKTVGRLSSVLSTSCATTASVNGIYVSNIAFTASNTFTIAVTNTTSSSLTNIPAPAVGNLVLTKTATGTISVASVSPSAAFTLAAGATQIITYTLSGTPTSTGTLTATWTYDDLTCVKIKNITLGDAVFASSPTAFVFSVNDVTSTPNINVQGKLDTATTIQMPYSSGSGTYIAYNSPFVSIPTQYCEDGASDWTFGYSYAGGTFATSGNITVKLITKKNGVVTAWNAKRVTNVSTINFGCVTAPWVLNGNTYTNTLGIDEGGDAIRGALSSAGCASCSAYDAAASNTLVPITLAEYTKLQTFLTGAALKGYIGNMNTTLSSYGGSGGFTNTVTAGSVNAMQNNSYIVAAAFQPYQSGSSAIQITAAASSSGAVSCITGSSPTLSFTNNVTKYFTVKRPTTHCSSNTLSGMLFTGTSLGFTYISGGSHYWGVTSCGGSSVNSGSGYTLGLQVIATTTKSW